MPTKIATIRNATSQPGATGADKSSDTTSARCKTCKWWRLGTLGQCWQRMFPGMGLCLLAEHPAITTSPDQVCEKYEEMTKYGQLMVEGQPVEMGRLVVLEIPTDDQQGDKRDE